MDDRQFDTWTRLLAGTSRRDALKSLAVGLIAGPLAVAGVRGNVAGVAAASCGKDRDQCNDNSDCCTDFKCKNNKCRAKDTSGSCGKDGERCKRSSDCCSNFRCKNDKCRSKN